MNSEKTSQQVTIDFFRHFQPQSDMPNTDLRPAVPLEPPPNIDNDTVAFFRHFRTSKIEKGNINENTILWNFTKIYVGGSRLPFRSTM